MRILGTSKTEKSKSVESDIYYPVLPLKNLVVFPSAVVPFLVGREMSKLAINFAMQENNKKIFLVMQKNVRIENPAPKDLNEVGTIAEILQILKIPDGTIKVLVEGIKRAKIEEIKKDERGFYIAKLNIPQINDEKYLTEKIEMLRRNVSKLFEELAHLTSKIPPDVLNIVLTTPSANESIDIIAAHIQSNPQTKQKLLSEFDITKRLKLTIDILTHEINMAKTEKYINEKVRDNIQQSQREYYLQEQLKVIKKELGEKGEYLDEVEELKNKVKKAKLPKEVYEKCKKEISRLEKMPPMSAEASVIRTYIDWILDLPWNVKTEDKNDLKLAAQILDEDHYGLKKVKERILEYMAVRQIANSKLKGQILCFVGPPGVGKTSLAQSIARCLNRNFVRISLGGVRDEAEIRGHRRTYVGALPGRIIQGMKKAKSKNPVFLMDEIDKLGTDFRGDPAAALLEVLDPEQNHAFSDHYLELPFDLSDVFFITTANDKYNIPKPLLDRMEVIEIPGYTEDEKLHIAEEFLIPKKIDEHGLSKDILKFSKEAILEIIRYYTREAGVRELERTIASICRKVAKKYVEEKKNLNIHIKASDLEVYLGPKKYRYGSAETEDEIGVATGLAWTEAGGDVLSIEVSVIPGTGKLILTGKLGEIMQESAQAALSYARSKATEFKLPENFYKKFDIHIHVPEGAVPKEGPSAGITIATALISALSKIPVRKDVAMTGEITLRGKVLPIGGVKEKVLSAHRANIKNVILPLENKKDFVEIPKEIYKTMNFYFVTKMEQVLKIALTKNDFINSDTGEILSGEKIEKKLKEKRKKIEKTDEKPVEQPVV